MCHLLSKFTLSQLQIVFEWLQVIVVLEHFHKAIIRVANLHVLREAIAQLRFMHRSTVLHLLSRHILHLTLNRYLLHLGLMNDLFLERSGLLSRLLAEHLVEFFKKIF